MWVRNFEYGGFWIPPDIEKAFSVIREDISITKHDMRFKRKIERDESIGLCGLKPGEYDRVTIQAYLNEVDHYAIQSGNSPEDITRGAFKVYMGLRLEEHLIRRGEVVTPESLAYLKNGGPKSGAAVYAELRKKFRTEIANRKKGI